MNAHPPSESDDALRRANLVLSLRSMGITSHRTVSAFESTARQIYTPPGFAADAYADRLIPIACGQTMEAPTVLARLLKAVPINEHSVVLEIGTGSGYFSALLGRLARRVVTLDRFRSLSDGARNALAKERLRTVECVFADGLLGWPAAAPYHAILVTGSVLSPPAAWFDQLALGGVLVAPIGDMAGGQVWVKFAKEDDGTIDQEVLGPAFAVPLVSGLARAL